MKRQFNSYKQTGGSEWGGLRIGRARKWLLKAVIVRVDYLLRTRHALDYWICSNCSEWLAGGVLAARAMFVTLTLAPCTTYVYIILSTSQWRSSENNTAHSKAVFGTGVKQDAVGLIVELYQFLSAKEMEVIMSSADKIVIRNVVQKLKESLKEMKTLEDKCADISNKEYQLQQTVTTKENEMSSMNEVISTLRLQNQVIIRRYGIYLLIWESCFVSGFFIVLCKK